jgi:hypothetical protein
MLSKPTIYGQSIYVATQKDEEKDDIKDLLGNENEIIVNIEM